MRDVDPGTLLEEFACKVLRRAVAAGTVGQLPGVALAAAMSSCTVLYGESALSDTTDVDQ